jgi:glyoxylase-like metal-dependent hydrolase (beta-lactamase superfamily II)
MHLFEKGPVTDRICISFAGFFPGFVIFGEKTALVDAGVPPLAPELYEAVREALGGRNLDYILLTHSHYDHVGCIPYLKRRFPGLKVVGSAIAKGILSKPEARAFMEKMSKETEDAMDFRARHPDEDISLNTDLLSVDVTVGDGDLVDLGGGVSIKAFETPGHTKCSVSYFMEPDEMLFAGESAGNFVGEGRVMANYLSDYALYMSSLEKVMALPIKKLGLPHQGMLLGREAVEKHFKAAVEGALEFKALVEEGLACGKDEKAIVDELMKKFYRGMAAFQPKGAFTVNLKAMVNAVRNAK